MLRSVDINRCKIVREQTLEYDSVESSIDAVNILRMMGYADAAEEYFVLLCLNVHGDIIGIHELSHGDVSKTIVSTRSIFQRALLNNASSIIVAHNHPSGSVTPSDEDITTTKHLRKASKIMEIPLFDHIILGSNDYTSMFQEGLM